MAEFSEDKKSIAKGTFWNLTGNIGVKLVSIVYTIILAHLFSESEIGLFFLAMSIVYILMTFSDLGLSASLKRHLPYYLGKKESANAYDTLRITYVLSTLTSSILAAALFILSDELASIFDNSELSPLFKLLSLFMIVSTVFKVNKATLISLKRMKELNLFTNLQNILKLVLVVALFLLFGDHSFVMVLALLIASFILSIASSIFVWGITRNMALESSKGLLKGSVDLLKQIFVFGISLAILSTLSNITLYTDRIMMGFLLPSDISAETIGIYSISISLALLLTVFSNSVNSIFLPVISQQYAQNRKKALQETSDSAIRWNLLLLTPPTITFLLFSGEILSLIYGQGYAKGALALSISCLGLFISRNGIMHSTILITKKIMKPLFLITFATLFINVILNWFLIPPYSMDGAAAATAISLILSTLFLVYYCRKYSGISFGRELINPLIAFALTFILLLVLKSSIISLLGQIEYLVPLEGTSVIQIFVEKLITIMELGLMFLITCFVYVIFLFAVKGVTEEDRHLFISFLKKARVPSGIINVLEKIVLSKER